MFQRVSLNALEPEYALLQQYLPPFKIGKPASSNRARKLRVTVSLPFSFAAHHREDRDLEMTGGAHSVIDGTRIRECPLIQNKAGHHRCIFNYRGVVPLLLSLQRQARTRGQDVGHRRCDFRLASAASHIESEGAVGGPQNRPG